MQQHTIRLHPLGKELKVNHQTPLIDLLHEYGIEFPCGGKGTCGKCRVRVIRGEIPLSDFHREKLDHFDLPADVRLACMSSCTGPVTLEIGQFDHLILADESDFDFKPEDGYGIAVDLGTSTIVTQLLDLHSGKILAVETLLNPQVRHGADLISRIKSGLDGHGPEMTQMIRDSVGGMIRSMLSGREINPGKIAIVGNTVMQRIFSGESLAPLSCYPFRVEDTGFRSFTPRELGWDGLPGCLVRFFPSIGSFVGSDILAGIAATGLYRKEKYSALIDLGTNGEIAIGNRARIICASTAAGPAFEGSNLSVGMRAVTGAVASFALEEGAMVPTVIGMAEPKGICGSALIDAVSILRRLGKIGPFGEITSGDGSIQTCKEIRLTQKDIYEFLLAKAAIATGIEILARHLNINTADIDAIFIAGGFGNYLNIGHLLDTGMLETTPGKIHKLGNTSLIGAKMFLFESDATVSGILARTTHVNLEGFADFQDIYVSKMFLEQPPSSTGHS